MACCRDFTRSQLLRSAAATPGRGLPPIEPGMPLPAGTGLTRRSMLLRAAGVALAVYGADRLGLEAFEEGIAQALGGPSQPVVVSIFLDGGADSLSVLAPTTDPGYTPTLRPTLHLDDAETLPMSGQSDLRWHASAAALKGLHDAGRVTVFPAIGYTSPNQSHFTSRHFYEVGALDTQARTGWLGRWLDLQGDVDNPIQGLSLEGQLSPVLATATVAVSAASSPGSYTFPGAGVSNAAVTTAMLNGFGALGELPTGDPVLGQARQSQRNAAGLRAQLAQPLGTSPVTYPANNSLAGKLSNLGKLLGLGLPIRAAAMRANGGYDTHSGQATPFATGLQTTSEAIAAFQADLDARGLADRVITLVWSEFGRRPSENGSGGTDHGAAGVAFVIGSRATGQTIGGFPGLAQLDAQGNLRNTADFRALYCSLLEDWLSTDAAAVIPGAASLPRYAVVR